MEAVFGGWGVSGIFHWTSGLPFSMGNGAGWSTNWELEGRSVQTRPTPRSVFTGMRMAIRTCSRIQHQSERRELPSGGCYFRFPYPGESGQRNNLRGPGYLELDGGLFKSWKSYELQNVKFAWEVFNATNTPRFDAAQSSYQFGLTFGEFGAYTNTLSIPRDAILTTVRVLIPMSSTGAEQSAPFYFWSGVAGIRSAIVKLYARGESLMRNRVRTCSEINSIAERCRMGSSCARYFMASTSSF